MKQIVLYGVSGASKAYTVLKYRCIDLEVFTIGYAMHVASTFRMTNPDVEHVYVIDNRYGLYREYKESMRQNSIEGHYIFKDTLEREGLKVF